MARSIRFDAPVPEDPQPGKGGKKQKRKECEEDWCTKGARNGFNQCILHGGGKRCAEPGCDNGAEGTTNFCVGHDGGKRCTEPGCDKSAVGGTLFCVGHDGGKRCEHGKLKQQCIPCGGSSICEHKRIKATCKDCDGSSICEHKRQKSTCKPCNGSAICKHGRIKSECTECPIKGIVPKTICKGCLSKLLSNKRREKGICAECDKTLPERTEITFGKLIIDQVGFEPNSKDKTIASGHACKGLDKRRPDLLWVVHGQVAVVVEIDEHSHSSGYEPSCETTKISEQNYAIQMSDGCKMIPVYTIRVNPDRYDVKIVQKKTRAKMVANKVKELLKGEYEPNAYSKVFFCCYHTSSNHLIEEHRKHWECEIL